MNINELFEVLQDEFSSDELNGELQLLGNVIIWSYNVTENSEELPTFENDDEEDYGFSYESVSAEELLHDAYQEDLEKIQEFLGSIDEYDNWSISDSEVIDEIITFKIF